MDDVLETEYAKYVIREGIFITKVKTKEITLEIAKKIVADRKTMTNGKPIPALIYIEGIKRATKEARDYFGSKESIEGVLAGALIMQSVFATNIANFFIKIAPVTIPNKVFTSEEKAIEWLKQYLIKP
jgi:hypothetical protein